MKNKGFTIVELLAVIVILGILSSVVVVGVSKYRQTVKQKELINLHSTIEAGYDSYRSKNILKGISVSNEVSFCDSDEKIIFDISYNGKRLTCDDIDNTSKITKKVKGELLNNKSYQDYVTNEVSSGKTKYDVLIKDGTCLTTATREKDTTTGEYVLTKECEEKAANIPKESKEEIICIYLKTNEEVLIDDYNQDGNSLCRFFK